LQMGPSTEKGRNTRTPTWEKKITNTKHPGAEDPRQRVGGGTNANVKKGGGS